MAKQPRSIFEEVSSAEAVRPAVETGVIDRGRGGARGAIRIWRNSQSSIGGNGATGSWAG